MSLYWMLKELEKEGSVRRELRLLAVLWVKMVSNELK